MAYFEDGHSAAWRSSGDRYLEDVLRVAQLVGIRAAACAAMLAFSLCLKFSDFVSVFISFSVFFSVRLLEVDGLNVNWERGVPSDWEGDLGRHGAKDSADRVPAILLRMGDAACNIPRGDAFDLSGQGQAPGYTDGYTDPRAAAQEESRGDSGEVRLVREMPMRAFRAKLIEHFDIQWKRHAVRWPSRTGVVQMAGAAAEPDP